MILKKMGNGFTLVEGLVSMFILALLIYFSLPAWYDFVKKRHLSAATEALRDTLKLAHSESTKQKQAITVAFSATSNWCVGLSMTGNCNCNTSGSCIINGAERVIRSSSYPGVSIAVSGLTSNSYVQFDGIRGVASDSGAITLSNAPYSIVLSVNKMGLLSSCSSTVTGYKPC